MSLTTVSGDDGAGPAAALAAVLHDGRRTAIDRMTAQCAELGGHGIIGASPQVSEASADGLLAGAAAAGGIEFTVTGTAIRAAACRPLGRPFTAGLSGQGFAKLITGGWVPVGIALGVSVAARHDDLLTTGSSGWGAQNAEVPAYTDLIVKARRDARSQLEREVRAMGADGVVVSGMTSRVRGLACRVHRGSADHFAEVVITGTAIARFSSPDSAGPVPGRAVRSLGGRPAGLDTSRRVRC